MELKYLPIKTDNIDKQPDRLTIELSGAKYIFEVAWNPEGECFVFDLMDEDKNYIIQGRKIVYGVDMLDNLIDGPDVEIYPMDKTGQAEKTGITFENFMDSVKCYIAGDE